MKQNKICIAYVVRFRESEKVFERKCERTFEFKKYWKEKLLINTFSEKSSFLKEFDMVK